MQVPSEESRHSPPELWWPLIPFPIQVYPLGKELGKGFQELEGGAGLGCPGRVCKGRAPRVAALAGDWNRNPPGLSRC